VITRQKIEASFT